jgi:deoxycytidylate deaminase
MAFKQKYLNLAILIADQSPHPQHKIGCVLVLKGEIVSVGFNQFKTHPLQKKWGGETKQFLHAEIAALVKLRSEATTAYIARVRRNGTLGLAMPCPSCMLALSHAGIQKIYWSE